MVMADKPTMDEVRSQLESVPDVLRAPFTVDQVMSLNQFQVERPMHPFTCPKEHEYPMMGFCPDCNKGGEGDTPGQIIVGTREHHGHLDDDYGTCQTCEGTGMVKLDDHREFDVHIQHYCLVALEDGWHCPGETCDYTQDWAWPWMADGRWKKMWSFAQEMTEED